jgi:hypothetical protein
MVMLGKVEDEPNVEAQVGLAVDLIGGSCRRPPYQVSLDPTAAAESATRRTRNPDFLRRDSASTAPAIGGPGTIALLKPERNEHMQVPGT